MQTECERESKSITHPHTALTHQLKEALKLIIWLLGVSIYLTANPHTHARIQPLFQSIGIFIGVEQ